MAKTYTSREAAHKDKATNVRQCDSETCAVWYRATCNKCPKCGYPNETKVATRAAEEACRKLIERELNGEEVSEEEWALAMGGSDTRHEQYEVVLQCIQKIGNNRIAYEVFSDLVNVGIIEPDFRDLAMHAISDAETSKPSD